MKSWVVRYTGAIVVGLMYKIFYIIFSPLTINSTFFLLDPFFNVIMKGNSLVFDAVTFSFIPACTAASAYLLLTVLILLTRGIDYRKGLKMFIVGSAAILIMNIVRIITLILVRLNLGKNYFDSLHLVFWYGVSTLFVVFVWITLVKLYNVKGIPVVSDMKAIWKYFQ